MTPDQGPIQVIPPGLISALGLKGLGQAPDTLRGSYQPVLETLDWIMQFDARLITANVPVGFAGNNFDPVFTVPPAEVWYVHQVSVFTQTPLAFLYITLALGIQQPNTAGAAFVTPVQTTIGAGLAAGQIWTGGSSAKPFWAPSSHNLTLWRSSDAAPPAAGAIELRYTPLRI